MSLVYQPFPDEHVKYTVVPHESLYPQQISIYQFKNEQPRSIICSTVFTTQGSLEPVKHGTLIEIIRNHIQTLAYSLAAGGIKDVNVVIDEHYGIVVTVTVNSPASRALKLWERLVEEIQREGLRVSVVVKWTGDNDVDEDTLVKKLVEITMKTGHRPVALPGFSAVEAVEEERRE